MLLDFSKYFLPDFSLAFMGALQALCISRSPEQEFSLEHKCR